MSDRRTNILARCETTAKASEKAGVRISNCRVRGGRLVGGIGPEKARILHVLEEELASCARASVQIRADVDAYDFSTNEGRLTHLEDRLREAEIGIGKIEVFLNTAGV